MKRIMLLLAAAALLCIPAAAGYDTSAQAMIIYHAADGRVLAEKNADRPLPMASTTKLMTALVVLERCDLSETVEILPTHTRTEGSSMYLKAGEEYTVEELLTGLLLASGNDAALALADHTAGSERAFAQLMNERAAELGMDNTHYVNSSGLPAEDHFSSARDLAILMGECRRNADFCRINGLTSASVHGKTLRNHNKLLTRCKGVNGGKTGYTKRAGRCLVSSCERDGLELICVTLNDRSDWDDHAALYAAAYRDYCACTIPTGRVLARVPRGDGGEAAVTVKDELRLCLPRGTSVGMTAELPRFVLGAKRAGTHAGWLHVYAEGEEKASWELIWAAEQQDPS